MFLLSFLLFTCRFRLPDWQTRNPQSLTHGQVALRCQKDSRTCRHKLKPGNHAHFLVPLTSFCHIHCPCPGPPFTHDILPTISEELMVQAEIDKRAVEAGRVSSVLQYEQKYCRKPCRFYIRWPLYFLQPLTLFLSFFLSGEHCHFVKRTTQMHICL